MDEVLDFLNVGAVLEAQHHRRRRRFYQQRIDPFDQFTNEEFIVRFCLSKDCVTNLNKFLQLYYYCFIYLCIISCYVYSTN